ncbi:MAG: HAD-IB family phosphatase [Candidatus Moranbacteria bacterium]|nr:HAD-IB family phosphatase [Candidatus Moranbacteria bacterium]
MKPKKSKLAVFDIDGTIFRSNLQFELLDGLAYRGVFPKKTLLKIIQSYRDWLENKDTYEKYKQTLIKLYRQDLKGKNKDDIIKIAKKVVAFYQRRTFVYTTELISELKKKNYMLLAISGSPVEIVREYNRYLKFDDVFGTVYEIDKQRNFTGREIYTPVKNKADALKRYVAEQGVSLKESIGVGDTESDISFLNLVERPIAFNSDLKLYRYAQKQNWEVIVERKDVVYKINCPKTRKNQ